MAPMKVIARNALNRFGHVLVDRIGSMYRSALDRCRWVGRRKVFLMKRHHVVILLRWLLFILLGNILLLSPKTAISFSLYLAILGFFAASNVFLSILGQKGFHRWHLDYAVVFFDVLFISLCIYLSGDLDLYFAYFMIILISALGRDIRLSIFNAAASAVIYTYVSYRLFGQASIMSPEFLFRMIFFYVVALITGYLCQEAKADENHIERTQRYLNVIRSLAEAKDIPAILRRMGSAVFDKRHLVSLDLLAYMPGKSILSHCQILSGGIEERTIPVDQLPGSLAMTSPTADSQEARGPENPDLAHRIEDRHSIEIIPIVSTGEVLGWLIARSKAIGGFGHDYDELLRLMSGHLSSEIIRVREEMSITQRNTELEALNNVNRAINQTLDLDDILYRIIDATTILLNVEAVSILLVDRRRKELVFKASTGLKAKEIKKVRVPFGHGIAGWVAKEAKPLIVADVTKDERFFQVADRNTGFNTKSIAAVPLMSGGKVIGVLEAINRLGNDPFTEHHLNILSGIALQAGIAIKMARLYRYMGKQTNEAIRLFGSLNEEKNRVETILASMSEGVLVCDKQGMPSMVNRRGMAMLHEKCIVDGREEKSLNDIELNLLRNSIADREEKFVKVKIPGKSLSFQLRATPIITPQGAVLGGVGVMEDVTEIQRLNEMKTEFISHVSHELRTPLTSVTGAASILLRGKQGELNPNQSTLINMIKDETGHMTDLVNNLLDLSRLEHGIFALKFEPGRIVDLARQALSTIAPLIMEKGIILDTAGLNHDLPEATMDKDGLRRVIINLLSNAVKFTPAGGIVSIGVSIAPPGSGAEADGMTLWIKDSGIGIPENELENVFEKFFRSRGARENGIQGTGLGLAISRQIVQTHGGRIWVQSIYGQGSTFYFTIPRINGTISVKSTESFSPSYQLAVA